VSSPPVEGGEAARNGEDGEEGEEGGEEGGEVDLDADMEDMDSTAEEGVSGEYDGTGDSMEGE
jgi:hypothetical protein